MSDQPQKKINRLLSKPEFCSSSREIGVKKRSVFDIREHRKRRFDDEIGQKAQFREKSSPVLDIATYQNLASQVLAIAKAEGATAAELSLQGNEGFSVSVRRGDVESVSYHQDRGLGVTVYIGHQKGNASTTDFRPEALKKTVKTACYIAQLSQADSAAGLAEPEHLAKEIPDLKLHYPWAIEPVQAIELAKQCEAQATAVDSRIHNSEGASIDTQQGLTLYANSQDFMGAYLTSRHGIQCVLVARDAEGNMQRDGYYTLNRNPARLESIAQVAQQAGERTVARLGARSLKTVRAPVIFQAEVAKQLIRYFLSAISGGALYNKASFLLDHLGKSVFADHLQIEDCPNLLGALGSAPFDAEGVRTQTRYLIQEGVLQGYLLSSYSARRLGMQTTGNAGGHHNILVSAKKTQPNLPSLLKEMGTGLLVTELLGEGVNLVTGDYSQGAAGFWVEHGQIQYPVEEITIAGNLAQMYRDIRSIAEDVDIRSSILTGSILLDNLVIAGR